MKPETLEKLEAFDKDLAESIKKLLFKHKIPVFLIETVLNKELYNLYRTAEEEAKKWDS